MRKVVITGSTGGIGSATCQYFKERDWYVIGVDVQESPEISRSSEYLRCDLASKGDIKRVFEGIAGKYEGIDALVNNAAIQVPKPLMQTTPDEWRRIFDVNVRATWLTTKYLHGNLKATRGSVVNIGSIVSRHTVDTEGAYAASKGAINALTRALAIELAGDRIRVNTVIPGAIRTRMLLDYLRNGGNAEASLSRMVARHPLGKIGEPEDVASAIYFLADNNDSSFITGASIVVDGGVSAKISSAE